MLHLSSLVTQVPRLSDWTPKALLSATPQILNLEAHAASSVLNLISILTNDPKLWWMPHPPIQMLKSNPQCDDIGGGAFGRCSVHESRDPMNGIKEGPYRDSRESVV